MKFTTNFWDFVKFCWKFLENFLSDLPLEFCQPQKSHPCKNKQGKTSVQKDESFPEWNQKVTLTELFPPLCQRIKLEIKHIDCLRSTISAVHYINLRNISNSGEHGFLPTFGPAFIQFYNKGVYAGQILFAMKTELHDAITLSKDAVVEPIPPLNEVSWRLYLKC